MMNKNIKEIGGYFSLELPNNKNHYHKNAIKLNTARNAFEHILKNSKINKVYIPYYNCEVMLEPLKKTNINYEYYSIDMNLEIEYTKNLRDNEYILYINYFGIKDKYINSLIQLYGNKLIIDNSQSFFSKFQNNILSIYSPRKFFGVSDGAYLIGDISNSTNLEYDNSVNRVNHLIGRVETSASEYYTEYKNNDNSLIMQDIKKMSKLTDLILSGLKYDEISNKRMNNFIYLNNHLSYINQLDINIKDISIPMIYPLLFSEHIKDILIKNKIYIATYWTDVLKINNVPENEKYITKNLIALPIDQRYNLEDMKRIVQVIKRHI